MLINEVMYNPKENENYYEWIELYNPTNNSINISGWSITDNKYTDYIEPDFDHGNGTCIIPKKTYAIIADKGTKIYDLYSISNETIFLYIDDKSIGNGLSNSGDKIILKNISNEIIDYVEWINNYSDVFGDPIQEIEENYTISKIRPKNTNDSKKDYYEGIPTPGRKNILLEKGVTRINVTKTDFLISKYETAKIDLEIQNLGDFSDNISIKIDFISYGWKAKLEKNTINLKPKEKQEIPLEITPCKHNCYEGFIKLIAKSEKKINESNQIRINFQIKDPDIYIKKIKIYNENKDENNKIFQGEIIRIKSFLKNLGIEPAINTSVKFYLDEYRQENFIGIKAYDLVDKYQKYPSILFDTIKIKPGTHKIIVIVDEKNEIKEIDEDNNILSFKFEIIDTSPNRFQKKLCITEFYYNTHPGFKNEYFKIFNPSEKNISLSDFYVTNNPHKSKFDQNKIVFPKNTIIESKKYLCITQTANDFKKETGDIPDFEYYKDSDENISDMVTSEKIVFGNNKSILSLKNSYNHTIDTIVYGNISINKSEWNGIGIKNVDSGIILKRIFQRDNPLDTNTSNDWLQPRIYKIGQTEKKSKIFNFTGEVKTFTSPDSSYETIVDEIRKANNSIFLNIYEFSNPFLCDELIKCLLKNISVNILIEGQPVGGVSDKQKFLLNRIKNYGGDIKIKYSNIQKKIYPRYRFNHAKYLIIDKSNTIIESCNWGETGVPYNSNFGNREWGIIIRNESVSRYFMDVFLDDSNKNFSDILLLEETNWYIPYNFYLDTNFYNGFYEPKFKSEVFFENLSVEPVFSPDTSFNSIFNFLNKSKSSIYVEQLYIYKYWDEKINPFVKILVDKARRGLDVRVIMNYNPIYDDTNEKINKTKNFLETNGVKVKLIYTNWSIFTNMHNKGIIVDNKSVLISSINWNENSFMNNREAGIIVYNKNISKYFCSVFFYDWNLKKPIKKDYFEVLNENNDKNTIYIVIIFTMTFALVIQDWRKRKWT